jgi:hypothetical protein
LVLLVLPAWAVDTKKGRGVETRVIMRQRYWAGKRQQGKVAVGRTEERSRSEGDKKERKNENDLVNESKKTSTAEQKNDIKKSWQRRGRVRMRRLKDVTSVTTKLFAGEIKGDVSQGINSAVKERKERIKKWRRKKKMRKFPERKTTFQEYTQRNTNEDNKNSSNEDLANKEIIKLNTSGSESEEMGDINKHGPLVIRVKDYDKKLITTVLENKGQKVGDVLLVNGRPVIVKKRRK